MLTWRAWLYLQAGTVVATTAAPAPALLAGTAARAPVLPLAAVTAHDRAKEADATMEMRSVAPTGTNGDVTPLPPPGLACCSCQKLRVP